MFKTCYLLIKYWRNPEVLSDCPGWTFEKSIDQGLKAAFINWFTTLSYILNFTLCSSSLISSDHLIIVDHLFLCVCHSHPVMCSSENVVDESKVLPLSTSITPLLVFLSSNQLAVVFCGTSVENRVVSAVLVCVGVIAVDDMKWSFLSFAMQGRVQHENVCWGQRVFSSRKSYYLQSRIKRNLVDRTVLVTVL